MWTSLRMTLIAWFSLFQGSLALSARMKRSSASSASGPALHCQSLNQPCGIRYTSEGRNRTGHPMVTSRDFSLCRCAHDTECPFDTFSQSHQIRLHRGRFRRYNRLRDTLQNLNQTTTLLFCQTIWPATRCRRRSRNSATVTLYSVYRSLEMPEGVVQTHCRCPGKHHLRSLVLHKVTRVRRSAQSPHSQLQTPGWRFDFVCHNFKRRCTKQKSCMKRQRKPNMAFTFTCQCVYGTCKRKRTKSKCKEGRVLNFP